MNGAARCQLRWSDSPAEAAGDPSCPRKQRRPAVHSACLPSYRPTERPIFAVTAPPDTAKQAAQPDAAGRACFHPQFRSPKRGGLSGGYSRCRRGSAISGERSPPRCTVPPRLDRPCLRLTRRPSALAALPADPAPAAAVLPPSCAPRLQGVGRRRPCRTSAAQESGHFHCQHNLSRPKAD